MFAWPRAANVVGVNSGFVLKYDVYDIYVVFLYSVSLELTDIPCPATHTVFLHPALRLSSILPCMFYLCRIIEYSTCIPERLEYSILILN